MLHTPKDAPRHHPPRGGGGGGPPPRGGGGGGGVPQPGRTPLTQPRTRPHTRHLTQPRSPPRPPPPTQPSTSPRTLPRTPPHSHPQAELEAPRRSSVSLCGVAHAKRMGIRGGAEVPRSLLSWHVIIRPGGSGEQAGHVLTPECRLDFATSRPVASGDCGSPMGQGKWNSRLETPDMPNSR